MSKRAGKWARTFIEGYNLTTTLNAVSMASPYNPVEIGGFTQDMQYVVGRADGSITVDGFLDDTANSNHAALSALAGTSALVTTAFGSNALPAVGDATASLVTTQNMYSANPDLNGASAIHAEWKGRGSALEFGVLLADTTVTANGNQSSVDQSAQTTNGGVGYLHITSLSAGDTITVLIEDSANDSTWATLITFTLDGTALDAERLTVSGTVDRYVRASYTVTGADVSFPIAVAFIRG